MVVGNEKTVQNNSLACQRNLRMISEDKHASFEMFQALSYYLLISGEGPYARLPKINLVSNLCRICL